MQQCNINTIVEHDFCICCGTCEQVCPHHAITSVYKDGMFLPTVDEKLCTDCGICQSVCPSHEIDVMQTYPKLDFEEESFPAYTIWTKDEEIRKLSTSGGAISTMIVALLDSNQYDKAYVLEYENFNGGKAVLSSVTARDGVLSAAKSKYIPASVERIIADIKNQSIGRAIIVATPCQLLAIKRYLTLRKMSDADLLFFGLFCDKTEKYSIYSHFEDKYGPFQSLHFRDKAISGWPGNVLIKQNGRSVDISREERMAVKEQFQMNRCRYCFDKLNMLADISFGDCYVAGCEDKLGRSSIVVRTTKGKNVFAFVKDWFNVLPISFKEIKQSQHLYDKQTNTVRNSMQPSVYVNIPVKYMQESNTCKKQKTNKVMSKFNKIGRIIRRLVKGRVLNQIIFIDNVGFVNKGDQLMIESVVKMIKRHRPNAQIVLSRDAFYQNPNYCIQNGIYPLQPKRGGLKKLRYDLAINLLINKSWLITPDMVDVILDCRGYHLGDPWIKNPLEGELGYSKYLLNYYKQFSKPSCKLILLPQALGPFSNEESKKCIKIVADRAMKIYAREKVSYMHLEQNLPTMSNVSICPDFTCLHHSSESAPIQIPKEYVLIIPNSRMIDQTSDEVSTNYLFFLKRITEHLANQGENVYFLNHEGIADERLLQELNLILQKPLPIITKQTGINIKRLIADSKLLITARFHGAVSGLTQGVPTLCTSWSHKYQELLLEHQCADNMLDILDIDSSIKTINEALKNPSKYSSKDGCIEQIENDVKNMWKEIFEII